LAELFLEAATGIPGSQGRCIERPTEALSSPDDALEAANAIREVIERILATILEWIELTGRPRYRPNPGPDRFPYVASPQRARCVSRAMTPRLRGKTVDWSVAGRTLSRSRGVFPMPNVDISRLNPRMIKRARSSSEPRFSHAQLAVVLDAKRPFVRTNRLQ